MNKNELNRMISLADEKYVDEIFEDRIYGKRKNIFVTFTAAAAALAVILGAGFIAANTVRAPNISETMPSGFTAAMPDDLLIDEAFDYSRFFENKITEQEIESLYKEEIIVGGNSDKKTDFGNDATRRAMPFDTSIFNSTSSTFFYDLEDNVEFISIHLGKNMSVTDDIEQLKMCDIVVFKESELLSKLNLENYFPVQRFGVGVYGFETNTSKGDNKAAIFCANGSEYMISGGQSMTYDEMGTIIDAVISNGISANSFDLSAGYGYDIVTENISLAEANTVEPFEGYIPQSEIFSLERSVSYLTFRENDEIVSQLMIFTFTHPSGGYIDLNYYTNNEMNPYSYDRIISIWNITPEAISVFYDNEEYNFTVDCGEFMINVTAKCTADELWAYIENIRDDTYSTENNTITLAEAANTPFAEFVPKTEKIGDLTVGNIYLEKGGENTTLTMDYSSQGRVGTFSYYGLVYHMDQQQVLENVVPIEIITKEYIEQLSAEPSGVGNNRRFEFSIDCGGIWINIYGDCTSEELWEYVRAIKDNAPYNTVTLAEANKTTPFAEYVPQIESIGNMKLYGGGARLLDNGELGKALAVDYREETEGGAYGENDLKSISVNYSQVTECQINSMAIVPFEELLFEDPANLKLKINDYIYNVRDNERSYYRFIVDCGGFFITVSADCTPDEMQTYIMSLVSSHEFGNLTKAEQEESERKIAEEKEQKLRREEAAKADSDNNILTVEKLKELAQKGGDLMWDDFDGYSFTDVGSGLCIRVYSVKGGYTLSVGGGSLNEKPMYVYLDANGKQADIRYESIDDIIG